MISTQIFKIIKEEYLQNINIEKGYLIHKRKTGEFLWRVL